MPIQDLVRRPIIHRGTVDGRVVPEQQLTQYISPGLVQLTDSVTIRQSRTLAIVRDGGMGDMIMLTPTLRALAEQFPHVAIHLFTKPHYLPLFQDNPHVNTVYPLNEYRKFAFDEMVDLQQFAERAPDAYTLDRASLFASAFGIELEDGRPEYTVHPEETGEARAWLAAHEVKPPWFALAPFATDPRRSWDVESARNFANRMVLNGWTPVLFHHENEVADYFPGMTTCVEPPLRIVAALLREANLVVSVDTGIYHLAAAARELPNSGPFLVVLFGLIAPGLRMKWYTNHLSLYAQEVDCCPCCENPDCLKTCTRNCMRALTGERVYKAVAPRLRRLHTS